MQSNDNGIGYEFPFSGGKNADAEDQLEDDVPEVQYVGAVWKINVIKFAMPTSSWVSKLPFLKRDDDAFTDNSCSAQSNLGYIIAVWNNPTDIVFTIPFNSVCSNALNSAKHLAHNNCAG